jgi:hypothetical protein
MADPSCVLQCEVDRLIYAQIKTLRQASPITSSEVTAYLDLAVFEGD